MAFQPSFILKPANISFAEQEPDESIELFLRPHLVTNFGWVLAAVVSFIAPVLLVQLDKSWNFLAGLPNPVLVGALMTWYMLILAYALESVLYWYFNIFMVTNQHIIDIDFISLLSRSVTDIEIKDIESVRTNMSGVARSLFNFGNVAIETAAKHQEVLFENVPYPDRVADQIEDLSDNLGSKGAE